VTAPIKNRRSIRLPGYDYSRAGAYFVTIVTQNRVCSLGEITAEGVDLSPLRKVVETVWNTSPAHFPIELDAFVIMPNHIHGILWIVEEESFIKTGFEINDQETQADRPSGTNPQSLASIIQNFKSVTSRKINTILSKPGNVFWQRNYYEHVVRDEHDLDRIRKYILDDLYQWPEDQENPGKKRVS
jgi:putative transposase